MEEGGDEDDDEDKAVIFSFSVPQSVLEVLVTYELVRFSSKLVAVLMAFPLCYCPFGYGQERKKEILDFSKKVKNHAMEEDSQAVEVNQSVDIFLTAFDHCFVEASTKSQLGLVEMEEREGIMHFLSIFYDVWLFCIKEDSSHPAEQVREDYSHSIQLSARLEEFALTESCLQQERSKGQQGLHLLKDGKVVSQPRKLCSMKFFPELKGFDCFVQWLEATSAWSILDNKDDDGEEDRGFSLTLPVYGGDSEMVCKMEFVEDQPHGKYPADQACKPKGPTVHSHLSLGRVGLSPFLFFENAVNKDFCLIHIIVLLFPGKDPCKVYPPDSYALRASRHGKVTFLFSFSDVMVHGSLAHAWLQQNGINSDVKHGSRDTWWLLDSLSHASIPNEGENPHGPAVKNIAGFTRNAVFKGAWTPRQGIVCVSYVSPCMLYVSHVSVVLHSLQTDEMEALGTHGSQVETKRRFPEMVRQGGFPRHDKGVLFWVAQKFGQHTEGNDLRTKALFGSSMQETFVSAEKWEKSLMLAEKVGKHSHASAFHPSRQSLEYYRKEVQARSDFLKRGSQLFKQRFLTLGEKLKTHGRKTWFVYMTWLCKWTWSGVYFGFLSPSFCYRHRKEQESLCPLPLSFTFVLFVIA